mgnify:CR=1 FL=1
MNFEADEEELISVIEKSTNYEIFLADAFQEISKYAPIERVE